MAVSRLGSRFAYVTHSVRRGRTRPRPRSSCPESAVSSPIRSRLIQDSDSIHTRAQEPEILIILNWPEVMSSGTTISYASEYALRIYRSTSIRFATPTSICHLSASPRGLTRNNSRASVSSLPIGVPDHMRTQRIGLVATANLISEHAMFPLQVIDSMRLFPASTLGVRFGWTQWATQQRRDSLLRCGLLRFALDSSAEGMSQVAGATNHELASTKPARANR